MVAGKNLDYLWILSREKTIPQSIKEDYLQKAKALGYNIDDLVWLTKKNFNSPKVVVIQADKLEL